MKGLLRRLMCKIAWHSFPVGYEQITQDGFNDHYRCKWCGYEGLVDSQGNLF